MSHSMLTLNIFTLSIYLLILLSVCECANILYIIPFFSPSHYIALRPIGLELAKRGHNVTVITSNKENDPPKNYHEVMAERKFVWDLLGTGRPNLFTIVNTPDESFHESLLWNGTLAFTELVLNSSSVKEFVAQDNKFDLVISEQFYQEALYALAYKYNAPLILVTVFGNCMRHNIITRNPLQLNTVLSEFLIIKDPKSFYGRLRNFYFTFYEFLWIKFWYLDKQNQLVEKYLSNFIPKPLPDVYELEKNAALVFTNSHFSFDVPIAYLPNSVEIGGLHLLNYEYVKSDLPEDLRKILDSSTQGVVYVSFGSNVQSTELPADKKAAFLKVFGKLKQAVLWKWEDDQLGEKPDNVFVRNWFPQNEVLSHPNVKVFICHGGLIGMQEAIFHGVPLIGIPVYADQYNNLLQAKEISFGRILEYESINEETLENELHEVLRDGSYMKKAKEVSRRFKDRPMTALQTAIFWIEYVIRNKGAEFMKNPARELSWIKYNMLDVYGFILGSIAFILFVIVYFIRFICSILFGSSKNKKNKKE